MILISAINNSNFFKFIHIFFTDFTTEFCIFCFLNLIYLNKKEAFIIFQRYKQFFDATVIEIIFIIARALRRFRRNNSALHSQPIFIIIIIIKFFFFEIRIFIFICGRFYCVIYRRRLSWKKITGVGAIFAGT